MTPLFDRNRYDPFKQGGVDELESFTLDSSTIEHKGKKAKRIRPRLPSSWYILQNELQGIIQENDSQNIEQALSQSEQENSNDEQQNLDEVEQVSQEQIQEGEGQKQSTSFFQVSNYQFKCPQWQAANPKKQLISKLKNVVNNEEISSHQQKLTCLKQIFQKYLCEYEKFYFEQSINNLYKQTENLNDLLGVLIKGIEQTFKRQIRGLSFEKRRLKLLRYLDKKKRRVWKKKVSYDCRKKVADGRLRIKGKFVTYEQACQQLGLASIEGYTPDQIKEMLYKKLEHS